MATLRRRRVNIALIKADVAYEIHELALLLGVHKSTVRNWITLGMPVMKARRPHLIKGVDAKAFLRARQSRRKNPCQPDELYCFSCRQPRRAWEGVADVFAINERKLRVTGLCESCGRVLSKLQPMRNAPAIAQTFRVQQWHDGHLIERMHPHLNCHLSKE